MDESIISRICTGRGDPYLRALADASPEELEAAEARVRRDDDADFPMDAARRLGHIRRAMEPGFCMVVTDPTGRGKVVAPDEEVPEGFSDSGFRGTYPQCLKYIGL